MSSIEIEELERFFIKEAGAFPGKVAYLFADMEGRAPYFGARAEERVVSASTIKVPVMMALFEKSRRENLPLETEIPVKSGQILGDSLVFEYGERPASLYELTVWMIVNSDNTATNVLLDYLGFAYLNGYFAQIGLKQARVERRMLDFDAVAQGRNNYISPTDFYRCMRLLTQRKGADPLAALALDILARNRDCESLCRYLYEGPRVAHKSGGLDDIVHDAGVVAAPGGDYFLGVFVSEFAPDGRTAKEARKLIGRLSRKTYDFKTRKC